MVGTKRYRFKSLYSDHMSIIGEHWFQVIETDQTDSKKSIYRLSKEKKHVIRSGDGTVSRLLKKKKNKSS